MFRFAVKYSAGYCYVEFLIEIIFSFLKRLSLEL